MNPPDGSEESSYAAINREERHYCAVLLHALLASDKVRAAFAEMIRGHRVRPSLDPERMEAFVEAAVLRDYWASLGEWKSMKEYQAVTHAGRLRVVSALLERNEMPEPRRTIDEIPLFWTGAKVTSKLRYPGNWSYQAIKDAGLDSHAPNEKCSHPGTPECEHDLNKERTAFKAIPDMLVTSPDVAVFIEGKLLSPEGKDNQGYRQFETTQRIATLVGELVPRFRETTCEAIVFSMKLPADHKAKVRTVRWAEVADCVLRDDGAPDAFTRHAFTRLKELSA